MRQIGKLIAGQTCVGVSNMIMWYQPGLYQPKEHLANLQLAYPYVLITQDFFYSNQQDAPLVDTARVDTT